MSEEYTGETQRYQMLRAEIAGCTLVQDLIPLYLDNEVTPESHALIADHLQHCERCSGYLAGARTVRTQILRDQQAVSAATAAHPTVAQMRQPGTTKLVVALWQSVMVLVYGIGLFLGLLGFGTTEPGPTVVGAFLVFGSIAGLLIVGSARTKSWMGLMALTALAGLLLVPIAALSGGYQWAKFAVYGLGMIALGGWGVWLHSTQQGAASGATQPLRQGAHNALMKAVLSLIGAALCVVAILGGIGLIWDAQTYLVQPTFTKGAIAVAPAPAVEAVPFAPDTFQALPTVVPPGKPGLPPDMYSYQKQSPVNVEFVSEGDYQSDPRALVQLLLGCALIAAGAVGTLLIARQLGWLPTHATQLTAKQVAGYVLLGGGTLWLTFILRGLMGGLLSGLIALGIGSGIVLLGLVLVRRKDDQPPQQPPLL